MKRRLAIVVPFILLAVLTLAGCGQEAQYTLYVTIENGPGCSVLPVSGTAYPAGTIVELAPTGATGYAFDHWGGTDGESVSAENKIVIDGNKHILAVFTRLKYDLTVEANPSAGGIVETALVVQSKSVYGVEHGQTVELTAKPNPGYIFDHWEGGLTGNENPANLTLTGQPSQAVVACFSPILHGYVMGVDSHVGIAGITVTADGRSTVTDENGFWQLKGVRFPTTVTASVSPSSAFMGVIFSPVSVPVSALSAADVDIGISGYTFYRSVGSYGYDEGQFDHPYGVALTASGRIYVTEPGRGRIHVFDASGTFLTRWGSEGTGDGQFSFPRGIALGSGGNVYIVDSLNSRIQKFSADGTYLAQWGSNGSGNGQFSLPQWIALDSSGNVYVTDSNNHRVQKFAPDGTYVTQWGTKGSGPGQLDYPQGIVVDTAGYVYVADYQNHRIQKFTTDGTFVAQWGSFGTGAGQFDNPVGIALDSAGCVYVGDLRNHRIQKFGADGTYITQWCSLGAGDQQLYFPEGVVVDSAGYVYVADSNNNRIQIFRFTH